MVLKKVTLRGFKSFADKTELEIGSGVTVIVGPNGCGKSNILDAIRWVLGEQNPRKLRGLQMQNVIFGGTQNRRPEGLAEASIVLDNSSRVFPIDFSEIQITRRLFRSGESDYLINKTPCRLKDITELFLDTGIGKSTYSVLEQGRVEQILNSKPQDRREIFEEAAGISKYKVRRDEAIRKLARTEQDLVRLNDILNELGRQVRSLKRQASLAERYEKYFLELQGLELTLMARAAEKLEQQMIQTDKDRQSCEDEKQATAASRAAAHAELAQTNERLSAMDQQLHHLAEKQIGLRGEMERWDEKVKSARERQAELQSRTASLNQEAEEATHRLEYYRVTLAEKRETTEAVGKETTQLGEEVAGFDQRQQQLISLVQQQETTVNDLRGKILRLQNELTAAENDQRRIERERELIAAQGQKLTQQQLRMAEEIEQLSRVINEKQSVADQTKARHDELEQSCEETSRQLNEVTTQWEACGNQLANLQAEIHAQSSRLASLVELERNREGYNDGVKFLLDERGKEDSSIQPKLLGTLADLMEVEKGFETAIEIALAHILQYLMVDSETEGARLLEAMAEGESGRAGFVPLDALTALAGEPLPESLGAADLHRGSDVVKFPEQYREAGKKLFGDVVIAPNLKRAREVRQQWGNRCRVITLQGEMIDTQGILRGGSHTEGGLLSRKREIADLEASLERTREQRSVSEERRESLKQQLDELKESLDRDRNERHQCQIQLAKSGQELEALNSQRDRLQRDQDGISQEQVQRASELSQLMENAQLVVERIDRCKQEFNDSSAIFQQEESLLEEKKSQLRQMEIERHGKEVALAEKRKDFERGNSEIKTLSEQIEQLEHLLAKRGEDQHTISQQFEQAAAQIVQAGEKSETLLVDVQAVEEEIEKSREARAALAELRTHQEEKLEEIDNKRRGLDDRTVESESDRVRLNLQKEDLARRFKHEFEKEYDDWKTVDRQEEKPQNELEDEADTLRNRIQRLGPVNRLAKQEYDEINERFEFLTAQKTDLDKARSNLMRTIAEIKRTARERFETVFAQVQENFRKTFRTMFGGGKADLILLDPDDIIESGVEIVAQPPGKNLQSISLMSGGEKALTAISLIFAIYLIKPSPFCILDEIDAPLDDVNIGRFTKVLRQFIDKSQFLIITHNKRTMEMGDAIYGVTMPQQGISQVMSMNFEGAHQEHATQGLAEVADDEPDVEILEPTPIPGVSKKEEEEPILQQEESLEPSAEDLEEELPAEWSEAEEPVAESDPDDEFEDDDDDDEDLDEELVDEEDLDEDLEEDEVVDELEGEEGEEDDDSEEAPRAKNGTKLEPMEVDDSVAQFDDDDFVPHKEQVAEEEPKFD